MNKPWKQTFSGLVFKYYDPQPEQIVIEDIAHALSNLCRFNGHCNEFFSVAEHSVLVSENVPKEFALEGLLHDAAEAYVGDMVTMLKSIMPKFDEMEHKIAKIISKKFGIPYPITPEVKIIDRAMLATEKEVLMGPESAPWLIGPKALENVEILSLCPKDAEKAFLNRYEILINEN